MKKLVALTLVSLCLGQLALAQEALDMSKLPNGNTMNAPVANIQAKPDSFQKIQDTIADDEKIECDANGCTFHTTQCQGKEFRIGATAGEGNQYGSGNGGVNIYTDTSSQTGINYNLSVTYIQTNYINKVKIDKSLYEFIKTNLMLASTKEHAKASMDQRDPSVSKELELALSAAIAMNGTACQNTQSTYAH